MGEEDEDKEGILGFEDQLTSYPLKSFLEPTQNNSEIDPNEFSQDSEHASQLSFNESDLSSINLNLLEVHEKQQLIQLLMKQCCDKHNYKKKKKINCRVKNIENWTEYVTQN